MKSESLSEGLNAIQGGLEMLLESKFQSMSALAEIAIIINEPRVRDYYVVEKNIGEFLKAVHYLLEHLNDESFTLVKKFIMERQRIIDDSRVDIQE
jgi:hypothetical protein